MSRTKKSNKIVEEELEFKDDSASEDSVIEIDTKFYVETEKKQTEKQRKRQMMKMAAEVSRKLKREQKAKEKKEESEGGDDERDEDAEEIDYGDTKSKRKVAKEPEEDESSDEDGEKIAKVRKESSSDEASDEEQEDSPSPSAQTSPKGSIEKAKKSKRGAKRSPTLTEEGEEIEYVKYNQAHAKFTIPKFEELEVFDQKVIDDLGLPEFQKTRLQSVPYRRTVKDSKIVGSQRIKMRKIRLGKSPSKYVLVPPRKKEGKVPLVETEEILYEDIPEDEYEELQNKYKEEYVKQYGGNVEDVEVPYISPRRIADLQTMDTEEIFKLCKARKLQCNDLVKKVMAKYADDTEENRDAAIRRALISRVENSTKGKIIPLKSPGKYYTKSSPDRATGKLKKEKNPHNSKFPLHIRVQFRDASGKLHKGLVKDFAKPGITVVSNRVEYKVKYTNPSLKVIKKSKAEKLDYMKFGENDSTLASILLGPVTNAMRERIRSIYTTLLAELRGQLDEKGNIVKLSKNTDIDIPTKCPSWEKFYEERFLVWRHQKYAGRILQHIDFDAISKLAEEQTKDQKDFEKLLAIVLGNLEEALDQDTTASDVIRAFRAKDSLTPFESKFLEELQRRNNAYGAEKVGKVGPGIYHAREPAYEYIRRQNRRAKEELQARKEGRPREKSPKGSPLPMGELEWLELIGKPRRGSPKPRYFPDEPPAIQDAKGEDLAEMMTQCIQHYIMTVKSVDENVLINIEVENGLEAYDNATLLQQFNKFVGLEKLKEQHAECVAKYERDYKKYTDLRKTEVNDFDLGQVEEEVRKYEEVIYNNHGLGKNAKTYLKKALIPNLFLQGPLAERAIFFREKLANGMIQFNALVGANVAHYLPEFVMGVEDAEIDELFGDQNPWVILTQSISLLLVANIRMFIDSYMRILNPTKRKEMDTMVERVGHLADPLKKILVSPSSICQRQTGTGKRPKIVDGKYVYKITGRGKGKKREQVFEDIPAGDVVICMTDDKFTCHSIEEIMIAMKKSENKPINLQTGKPYPKSFLEKFKQRYAGLKNTIIVPSSDEALEPLPKTPSPKKIATPKKVAKTYKHHKPTKGKKFKEVTGIYVVGDEIETLPATTGGEIDIPLNTGKILTISLTNDLEDASYEPNVAIISFDASQEPSLEQLEVLIDSIPDTMDVYVIGVGNVETVNKTKYSLRIRKLSKRIKQIFYVSETEKDVINGIIDVVIDVEGVKVKSGKTKKQKDGELDLTKVKGPDNEEGEYIPWWSPKGGWRYED